MKTIMKSFLGFGLILTSLLYACFGNKETNTSINEQAVAVKGELIEATSKQLSRAFTGSIEGEKQAAIRAKIAEAVEKIHVRTGDYVNINDVIVSLDRSGPTSNYMQAYSVFQNAEKNFNKLKYLYEEGAVSETQFDGARTEYEVSKANYDAALQTVELRTPIAGRVTSIDVYAGQYVSPGQQIATVASTAQVRMKFGVSGNDIAYFREGQMVSITVEADSIIHGDGTVLMVARSADPVTRTFQIDIKIDNKEHLFKPGMFARASVIIGDYENIVVVPRQAIINRDNRDFVFVAINGSAVMREVTLGVDFNGVTEISSGLLPGDTLITIGQNYLKDGGKIKIGRLVDASGKEIQP